MKRFLQLIRHRWFARTALVLTPLLLFWLGFVNYTEPTQLGIARNRISGEMWAQGGGIHFTPPWVWVARIDTRPIRVTIASGGHGYSSKLVQFNPKEWREFVDTEGFRYWWWSNRLSFNLGYSEEHRGMKDILRGYAYGNTKYRFFNIIKEYEMQ